MSTSVQCLCLSDQCIEIVLESQAHSVDIDIIWLSKHRCESIDIFASFVDVKNFQQPRDMIMYFRTCCEQSSGEKNKLNSRDIHSKSGEG